MLRLVIRGVLFLMINGVIALAVIEFHESRLDYEVWDTDSVLLTMPHDAAYGAVFLGSSHAYLLTRFQKHHNIVVDALDAPVYNLALPSGGGLRPAHLLLEEFFARGNTSDHLVYFLDPFVFFGTGANDAHKFVYDEPLDWSLLLGMLRDGYPFRRTLTYLRSKFSTHWLIQDAETMVAHPGALTPAQVDPERIQMRIDSLYVDGTDEGNFSLYAPYLEHIVELGMEHGTRTHIVVPPTLLGMEPGHARMMQHLQGLLEQYDIEVLDWHAAVTDPALYYNLDHLNTTGVEVFAHGYLKPLLVNE